MWLACIAFAVNADFGQASSAPMPDDPPATAVSVDDLDVPDLQILRDQNRLYFTISDGKTWPATIKLPRLANVVRSIRWSSETEATMQIKPEPTEWSIVLSEPPNAAKQVIIAELDSPVEFFREDKIIEPGKDSGVVLLPARNAVTRGTNLRFEPQLHKNTVGYWSHLQDTAEWSFRTADAGTYEIDILQGCGKGHGGSRVRLQVADQTLDFTVEETGHFQNFVWRKLGSVPLTTRDPAEPILLKLTPLSKPGGAVMDVRAVRLCPAGSKRAFTPELAEPESLPDKFKH